MKKARKLLVTLLVLTFVMSMFNVGFAAEEEKLPTEVVRAQALGILKGDDQGNLNLDQPITRAEALALIVRISGLEKSAELMAGQTQFADVNAAPNLQWATGYINLGVGQGIVNGYPDGTFKGTNQVTYAEMAKMLLYAMNYGVTVEGGVWPAAVMGKADDLGIFDKVNALPNIPALRGDVVKMIDNSLTVNHLKQTGFGDLTQYLEDVGVNFLSKMDVEELEDLVVTEIAKVNSKLDADEIELTEYDKDGEPVNSDIYTLIADVNPEEIFGLKVDAWVNDDDEVIFVKVKTADKNILFDSVVETSVDEVELKIVDDEYDWAVAKVYQNFKEVKVEDISAGAYGRFVLDRGEVVFANLFDFDDNDKGLVTEVDGDIIEFIALADAKDDELDLDDYEEIYVYDKNFKALDKEDIVEDSLIYFWANDDDEIFIIVDRNEVKGEVDRVRDDEVRIGGKAYDQASEAIVSYDDGENYEIWVDVADVEDFTEENVIALLALDGDIAVIRGDAVETSDRIYGVATYAKVEKEGTLSLFNKEGKIVDYTADKRGTLAAIEQGKLDYYGTASSDLSYAAVSFKLNRDGEISDTGFEYAIIDKEAIAVEDDPLIQGTNIYYGNLTKDEDKTYFEINDDRFYVSKSTIIIGAISDDELDPSIISYDDFVEMSIQNKNYAVVFGGIEENVKMIVFTEDGFKGVKDEYYFGIVTSNPWVGRRATTVEVDVAGEGKVEYKVDEYEDYFKKGNIVVFTLNSQDEAEIEVFAKVYGKTGEPNDDFGLDTDEVYLVAGVVDSTSKSFIKVNGRNYRFASDAVVYDYKEDNGFKLDGSSRMSRISQGDYVIFAIDADSDQVKAAAVYYEKDL